MERKASAKWQGGLKDGKGTLTSPSGVLKDTKYSFSTRFENEPGTNPEELIAAAHAGCFSMALSGQLGQRGMTADEINTSAAVTLEKVEGGFDINKIHLTVRARIPNGDNAKFEEAANAAKAGCPVSKVLNATITMDAKLESAAGS
jgi:lipoyl-dependent peroxiredoxin